MEFLRANADLISVIANSAMVVVWLLYFQLMHHSYRRRTRSSIVITHGKGDGMDACCFVTNMSDGQFFLTAVAVRVQDGDGKTQGASMRQPMSGGESIQGPLGPGEWFEFGRFGDLLSACCPDLALKRQARSEHHWRFEVFAAGVFSTDSRQTGARNDFLIRSDGKETVIEAGEVLGRQYRTPWARWKLIKQIRNLAGNG